MKLRRKQLRHLKSIRRKNPPGNFPRATHVAIFAIDKVYLPSETRFSPVSQRWKNDDCYRNLSLPSKVVRIDRLFSDVFERGNNHHSVNTVYLWVLGRLSTGDVPRPYVKACVGTSAIV